MSDVPPTLSIASELDPNPCRSALIWAEGIQRSAASETLPGPLAELVVQAQRAGDGFWPPAVKKDVRDMLRFGKYKPSGRSKPASEFLLKAAHKDAFPAINPLVDCNNYISLASGLPGSIFDTELTGERLILRRGVPGERYVFNASGQEIALQDLLLVAREDGAAPGLGVPCGNPVKDSVATKIRPGVTSRVVAVLYAPVGYPEGDLASWAHRFADLLVTWCGATNTGVRVYGP